jgi:hypothetical protein
MKILTAKILILFPAVLAIFALSSCSADLPSINAQDDSAPSINIILPRDAPGEPNIPGEGLAPVLVKVSNFKLIDAEGGPNTAGEGHIHYYLDADPASSSRDAGLFSTARYAESSETIYYWPDIGKGSHTFWAELVNNDHTPLNPRVISRSRISTGGYSEG